MKWGHIKENPARGVDLPALRCVRPKWALTTSQAAALLADLPVLPRTMVGLAILSGLRRGELFALRWKDIDEQKQLLTVREAVYDSTFSAPKTAAGLRQIPLSELARLLIAEWRAMATNVEPGALVFATSQGTPILPNNVVRRSIVPACKRSPSSNGNERI
jgi:integrase